MIRRDIFFILAVCLYGAVSSAFLFSESDQVNADYHTFLSVNRSYTTDSTVLVKQVIIKRSRNANTADTVYCLFHRKGQCVKIPAKTGAQYFFSSDQGYWLLTKKLRTPLKVSGAYKIEEFEVQDILKTDFENSYQIISEDKGILTLERKTEGPAYRFILFTKTAPDIFELTFTDARKTPLRTLVYHRGTVGGYDCFRQIDVYNLLFDKGGFSSWSTEWIKPVDVPASLFSYSQMKALGQKIDTLIE
ncbi:MAG: hypothetical protein P1P65_01780 [Treponema sp.]